MSPFFVGSYNHIEKYDEIDDDSRKNVKAMETSNEKEKSAKIYFHIRCEQGLPLHYTNGIFYFIQGIVS